MPPNGYDGQLTADWIEGLIREYFSACNDADAPRIAACFEEDGVHYFPPGMYEGPFRGAETIARRWVEFVATIGSMWTIDQLIVDAASARAVIEWSHFKTSTGTLLRGDEWYDFSPETGLVREIRAYYASPQDSALARLELGGFDYAGRGYQLEQPFVR